MWSSNKESSVSGSGSGGGSGSGSGSGSSSSSSRNSREVCSSSNSLFFSKAPSRRTMEEVWKDINYTTKLHDQERSNSRLPINLSSSSSNSCNTTPHAGLRLRGIILQDFLAGPLNQPISKPIQLGPPLASIPPTVLSLRSSLEFNFDARSHQAINAQEASTTSTVTATATATATASPVSSIHLFSFCPNKRMPESPQGAIGGEGSNKRMIRNRESAARSRARKQAYTNGLELEVAHLLQENAKLKKQHDELCLAMTAQLTTKNTLRRSSSSPF
ncbi:bZIP transcription factor 27-like [Typha angustifolia]|uniref:bZIP transcription factor 27-like n=1 Tax=Typha angustifolia TaxID=59011 RepID=UPI003C2CF486